MSFRKCKPLSLVAFCAVLGCLHAPPLGTAPQEAAPTSDRLQPVQNPPVRKYDAKAVGETSLDMRLLIVSSDGTEGSLELIKGALDAAKSGEYKKADWDASWRVGPVDDAEWQDLIDRLRTTYHEVRAFASTFDRWDEQFVGGAFALVGHCAYHLGEIRQGLGVLRG